MKMVPWCHDGYSIRMGMTTCNYSLANQTYPYHRKKLDGLSYLRQPLENLSLPFYLFLG